MVAIRLPQPRSLRGKERGCLMTPKNETPPTVAADRGESETLNNQYSQSHNDNQANSAIPEEADRPDNRATRIAGLSSICMADVVERPVAWLWPGRVALGKLTIIAGDPGLGKSFLSLDMAARVSCGGAWPDNPEEKTVSGSVILLSAEDGVADTIKPRLIAAGANLKKIEAITTEIATDGSCTPFVIERDLPKLDEFIRTLSDVRLVVIDPILAYCGKKNSNNGGDVRALLAPVSELATNHNVAVVAVTHHNKSNGDGSRAMYRVMGSLSFVAAARAAWGVVADRNDPSRRLFLPIKNNLAKSPDGLAYSLVESESPGVARVEWEPEPVMESIDDAMGQAQGVAGRQLKLDYAREWIEVRLADGPVEAALVMRDAVADGISKSTLRRAWKAIGGDPRKTDFEGGWIWSLPVEGAQLQTSSLSILGRKGNESGPAIEMPTESERLGSESMSSTQISTVPAQCAQETSLAR